MKTKHTPGPLSVSFGTKWPFDILIVNQSGDVVYRELLPCHSSKDKNFEEALNCWNFKGSEQEEYAAINHRAVADAYLRAAAPDLLEALKEIMSFTATAAIGCHGEKCREPWCHSCNGEEEAEAAAQKGCDAYAKARAAIARATGESK